MGGGGLFRGHDEGEGVGLFRGHSKGGGGGFVWGR